MKSDRELIDAINNGQSDAFEVLYYRYRDWIYNLAWRFTGNQSDALDVLQETFTYLLGKFPGFELTASMTTFFYPVVKHISLNLKMKNRKFTSENDISEEIIDTKKNAADHNSPELAAVLNILPDELREILLMKYVDEMSQDEIAQALNMPVGTVKSRLYRALQTLRQDARTRSYFIE
ncbi:MAG: sigma-70 family RNA polymerase sigma factor [Sedimentisphaerales bacterium]|nr:sigma-70 family RNA polymerase sigma factor [Sedimentisphaerales bacterium]